MKGHNGELKKGGSRKGGGSNVCVGLGLFVLLYMSAVISVGIVTRVVCGHECFYSLVAPSADGKSNDDECVVVEAEKADERKKKLFAFFSFPKRAQREDEDCLTAAARISDESDKCRSSLCLFCGNALAAAISPYSFPTAKRADTSLAASTTQKRPAGRVKRMIDQAAAFFKHRKQKHKQPHSSTATSQHQNHIATKWRPDAVTPAQTLQRSQPQQALIRKLSPKVIQAFHQQHHTDHNARLQHVYWGSGEASSFTHRTSKNPSFPWWFPNSNDNHAKPNKRFTAMTNMNHGVHMEGSSLLAAYLKIMEWPQNMKSTFPYKLCAKGCDAQQSLAHTLEWREKYKPWCISPALIKENSVGWIYHRGHARADFSQYLDNIDTNSNSNHNNDHDDLGGHAMIWYRPGLYQVRNPEFYTRNLLHALDAAVAETLQRTHGTIGKYNIVLDCTNFSFAMMPRIHDVKRGMIMMQDHFPDRLGILLLANLSGPAQLFLKIITPFITEKVRNKIHAVPNDPQQRMEALEVLIEDQYIPDWLGGKDTFRFHKNDWYQNKQQCTDEQMLEYLTTMPYHA